MVKLRAITMIALIAIQVHTFKVLTVNSYISL